MTRSDPYSKCLVLNVSLETCDAPPTSMCQLLRLGASVVRCIQAAQRHGHVVIVTESDEHWVRGTAELLLPSPAVACLKNIDVVSSRERFGKVFPGQKVCWQIAAFSYVTNRHLLCGGVAGSENDPEALDGRGGGRRGEASNEALNGDNNRSRGRGLDGGGTGGHDARSRTGEHNRGAGMVVAVTTASRAGDDKSAMRTLRDHHPNIVAKTVSLIKAPTPQELRKQLDLLSDNFAWMFGHPRDASPSPVSTPQLVASTLSTISPQKAKNADVAGDDDAATNTTEGYNSVAEDEEERSPGVRGAGLDAGEDQANGCGQTAVLHRSSPRSLGEGE